MGALIKRLKCIPSGGSFSVIVASVEPIIQMQIFRAKVSLQQNDSTCTTTCVCLLAFVGTPSSQSANQPTETQCLCAVEQDDTNNEDSDNPRTRNPLEWGRVAGAMNIIFRCLYERILSRGIRTRQTHGYFTFYKRKNNFNIFIFLSFVAG